MLYVAFERAGSGSVKPSTTFNRTYHTSPHVKSAVAMRYKIGGNYELANETDDLLTFKPKKASPGALTFYFVNVESTGAQLVAALQKKPAKPAKPAKAAAVAANGSK